MDDVPAAATGSQLPILLQSNSSGLGRPGRRLKRPEWTRLMARPCVPTLSSRPCVPAAPHIRPSPSIVPLTLLVLVGWWRGVQYTLAEFVQAYGGTVEWESSSSATMADDGSGGHGGGWDTSADEFGRYAVEKLAGCFPELNAAALQVAGLPTIPCSGWLRAAVPSTIADSFLRPPTCSGCWPGVAGTSSWPRTLWRPRSTLSSGAGLLLAHPWRLPVVHSVLRPT